MDTMPDERLLVKRKTSTRRRGCGDDRALIAAHARLVALDEAGLAEVILAESHALADDPRVAVLRLAAVELAGRAAGVRRHA